MNKKIPFWLKIGGLAGVLTIVLTVAGIRMIIADREVTKVDFSAVVSESIPESSDCRPKLRVAVSAIISTESTRRYYEDLLGLVAERMGMEVVFLQRKTSAEINDLMETKEADVSFVRAGAYVKGHEKFGMEILVVPVSKGGKVHYSYILANIKSAIKSLDDLRGKRFAYTDIDSNTGCDIPKFMLAQEGESDKKFFSGTFFTYSHDNSIQAVAENLADGCAVDSLIWEFMNSTDPEYTSQTRIIAKSLPYGIPPVVVHPDIDPQLKSRLRKIFLNLHKTEQGKSLLEKMQIERFEISDDRLYDSIRVMRNYLAKQEGRKL